MLTFFLFFFPVPSASPQNLTGFANSSRYISLFWLPPPVDTHNGVIQRYRVSISVIETRTSLVLFSEDTELEFDVAHPYYTYTFAVAAETIGTGPYGEELTITTPEDGNGHTISMIASLVIPFSSFQYPLQFHSSLKLWQLVQVVFV